MRVTCVNSLGPFLRILPFRALYWSFTVITSLVPRTDVGVYCPSLVPGADVGVYCPSLVPGADVGVHCPGRAQQGVPSQTQGFSAGEPQDLRGPWRTVALQEAAPTTGGGILRSGGEGGREGAERERDNKERENLIYVYMYFVILLFVLFAFPCRGNQARMLLLNFDSCSIRHASDRIWGCEAPLIMRS